MEKAYLYGIGIFIVVLGAFAALASGGDTSESTSSSAPTTSPAATVRITRVAVGEVADLMAREKELVILDVRTPEEFSSGHLDNALNIDYRAADVGDRIDTLDHTKPYLAYCRTGVRSAEFTKIMQQKGFEKIYDMEGGITAWHAAGLSDSN